MADEYEQTSGIYQLYQSVLDDQPSSDWSEEEARRRFVRVPLGMDGYAASEAGSCDAFVLNMSSNGARIRLEDADLPGPITHLVVPELDCSLACEMVWRSGDCVGLRFTERPYEVAQSMPLSIRFQMLPSR